MSYFAKFFFKIKHNISYKKIQIVALQNYDALFVRSGTQVTADVIAASKLKFIGRAGVGVDNIDVNAATSKGVIVVK
ncbi:hypothetical protein RND71_044093 [Anisodus tanguticus]|uniref:D-isomer specific 2-hydroxyacid dehydrogenase catalytic domain-containing protein n=1 Tax=Anisodus tanguticus TaxID=243964 RepID=A0AAE1UTU6_9SOLA|nr:hypothetical protein RND71_044093 [Anisodus tanguticus]